jgi:hypothetical protein
MTSAFPTLAFSRGQEPVTSFMTVSVDGVRAMTISFESVSAWAAIASVLVSAAAACVAWSSLSQAKRVADRDRRDWKQRKWFDLYFKANEAYDFLDRFQTQHKVIETQSETFINDWNDLMSLFREVHSMAVVFPKCTAIDELLSCTAVFKNPQEALSKDRLQKVLGALEGIRQRALVDPIVLG